MIPFKLASLLAIGLGLVSGSLIFILAKKQISLPYSFLKIHKFRFAVPGLVICLLLLLGLNKVKEPVSQKVTYHMTQDEFTALSGQKTENFKMKVRQTQPESGFFLLRSVYKEHLLSTVLFFALLALGNKKKEQTTLKKDRTPSNPTYPLTLDKEDILKRLNQSLLDKKLYSKPSLNLDDLAESLSVSKYHLSQLINRELGKNFYEVVNDLRVNAAIEMMNNPKNNHLTLSAIGFEVGFNSKASFYRAFKRNTNTTPAAYKRQLIR